MDSKAEKLNKKVASALLGGGEGRIEKQHKKKNLLQEKE